ncbi:MULTISPECIES: TetR/AcrR family transcriptional regulator [unclassified Azospirillum]|uniref:TetR/AcrR family transcriptional regulator n=1 Tax=unclassified Azospirillum TaxID=2630922 RepID=UPI000B65CD6B|nr:MULTISPECIES: TetR/AcrR family transcriptional regulator [unclassified Azospirillum]SNS58016.1 transcriptional regulator, TetR family [Azospirillum sp. RU38E]SNS77853.1 transcriptional regulator, TetR family [Azospirillum sp. RU37A]
MKEINADVGKGSIQGVASRVRQTPKSIATHHKIIDAAIRCFLDLGYHRTTTSEIAKLAGVTRGAVQYYFPTTPAVLRATVDHITQQFMEYFHALAAARPQEGGEGLDQGLDALWQAGHHPLWTAWKELEAAARTDAELAGVMGPAKAEFYRRWEALSVELYGSYQQKDPVKFEMGHHLTWQFLQALAGLSRGDEAADIALKQRLLAEFKNLIRGYWDMG